MTLSWATVLRREFRIVLDSVWIQRFRDMIGGCRSGLPFGECRFEHCSSEGRFVRMGLRNEGRY